MTGTVPKPIRSQNRTYCGALSGATHAIGASASETVAQQVRVMHTSDNTLMHLTYGQATTKRFVHDPTLSAITTPNRRKAID